MAVSSEDTIPLLSLNDCFTVDVENDSTISEPKQNEQFTVDVDGDITLSESDCSLPLPPGKTHHLFLSHSSKDDVFARKLHRILEKDCGIKCVHPDRDFIGGRTIPGNIADKMKQCVKILLLLSPNSFKSGFCKYEWELALTLAARNRTNVILILLKPCEIPHTLQALTYIDAAVEANLGQKIKEALLHQEGEQDTVPCEIDTKADGMTVQVPAVKEFPSRRGVVMQFKSLTENQRHEMDECGIEIDENDYDDMRQNVNKMALMRWSKMFNCSAFKCRAHFCCFLCNGMHQIFLAMGALCMLLLIILNQDLGLTGVDVILVIEIFIGIAGGLVLVWCCAAPCIVSCWYDKLIQRTRDYIWNTLNQQLADKKTVVMFVVNNDVPTLCFMRYDIGRRMDTLMRQYRPEYPEIIDPSQLIIMEKYILNIIRRELKLKEQYSIFQGLNDERHIVKMRKEEISQMLTVNAQSVDHRLN